MLRGLTRQWSRQAARSGHYKLFESSCPCDFTFELVVTKAGYKQTRISKSSKEANAMKTLDVTVAPEPN